MSAPGDPHHTTGVPSMLRSLSHVLSPIGFPYASNWHLFRDAEFGRDALEVAEDLLDIRPEIARTVIVRLAELQGRKTDPRTEEEPGRIHHEYRALRMHGLPILPESVEIFRSLARRWNLANTDADADALREWTYYGTVDATPLYVRLIADYVRRYGTAILQTPVRREGDPESTVLDSALAAVRWVAGKVENSDLGLLEWKRMNPEGHVFQAWKDGSTSYLHPDGSFANYNGPIASIEVQGLAYDALLAGADLLPSTDPAERDRWLDLAERLRGRVFDLFWMPDVRYFAMAIDRDPATGSARQVRLISSNGGAVLDSHLFDALTESEREKYVSSVTRMLYSPELMTPVGVRCSAVRHGQIQDYMGYQSTFTVWHKETFDIARGLERQGMPALGADLDARLLNAVNVTGGALEFLYILPDGEVAYRPAVGAGGQGVAEIAGTNLPEQEQAWSISAALAIKWRNGRRRHADRQAHGWQAALQHEIFRGVAPVTPLRTAAEVVAVRAAARTVVLNTRKGWEREHAFQAAHALSR